MVSVRPSVCLSVPSIDSGSDAQLVYCGPGAGGRYRLISYTYSKAFYNKNVQKFLKNRYKPVAGPGGVQGVQTPALLFRCPFLKRIYFENMSLRFLAEQGSS